MSSTVQSIASSKDAATTTGFINSVETFGTVDGPGVRYVLFLNGCPLQCKYCHNRDTWNMSEGREVSVSDVAIELAKYADIYKSTGGGVTASGGEPTLQPAFVTQLFRSAKQLDLNTALDTSGYIDAQEIDGLLEQTDLVILDLKHMLPEAHQKLTGVDNSRILQFTSDLARQNKTLWVRQVLIPGINDNQEQLKELADFLRPMTNVQRIELLGFHKMGSHKWHLAGCPDPLESTPAATPAQTQQAKDFLRSQGLKNVT